jgi:hypothetical protein
LPLNPWLARRTRSPRRWDQRRYIGVASSLRALRVLRAKPARTDAAILAFTAVPFQERRRQDEDGFNRLPVSVCSWCCGLRPRP